MTKTPRERLARLLDDSESEEKFSAELREPAESLQLEVSGVGPVRLPIRAPLAKKLIGVARPAKYGHGEQTLTDTSVRDTWEITPDQVTLGGPGWTTVVERALEHFRDELGLPRHARLRTELHSMLVYGKGQFFLPHQDSEKHDAMVGTLVVSLPSPHTGGELVIEHGGRSESYPAPTHELSLVAFYADCRHQVTPVRSGYRLALTFNLLVIADAAAEPVEPDVELAQCLTEHFTEPATPRYGGRDLDPPRRLVFLLDHEYTQRGLNWRRLKGVDAERAALLRAAAEQAGCAAVLALAEVKETWDALPRGPRGWHRYDDLDLDPDPDDVELNDLIEDEITLGWWAGPDGGESIALRVPDYEVCSSTPSVQLEPYQSEYEGYMGNYGNTMDRWYRRAAVVVWPHDRAFAARAEAGSPWALRELLRCIEAGESAQARGAAASLAPFWNGVGAGVELFGPALEVAAGLGVPETAAMLLQPFRVELLTPERTGGLAAVKQRYGSEWMRSVVDGWFGPVCYDGVGRAEWIDDQLVALSAELRAIGTAETAGLLTAHAWDWLSDRLRTWTAVARDDVRRPQLERLSSPLARLLEAAGDGLRDRIAGVLREYPDTVLECVLPALRLARGAGVPGLDAIALECARRLDAIVARPPRDDGDWSIGWTGCGCDLCDTLGEFLGSSTRRTFEWPLVTARRQHVHDQIDSAGLPVRHLTRRQGRPYTLVLTKTEDLFTREVTARRRASIDLTWLNSPAMR